MIDYENVQPKNLELLGGHPFKVFVFVGEHQNKIPIHFAAKLQSLGENAQYIQIMGSGQDALDFHIAFYIGELSATDAEGYFHIISKDKGFDPLIKHLRERKIKVHRETDIAEIPLLRLSKKVELDPKIDAIITNLDGRGQSRPRKVKTLTNTIQNLFAEELSESELLSLVKELKKRKFITLDGDKVSYM